jgi:hypothetical protein
MKSSSLIWLTAVSSQANHSECRDHNMLDDRKCSIALLLQLPDAALCLMRVCITRRYPAAFHHCGCSMFWQRWQGTATDKKNCCMDRAPGACLTVCLTTEPTCSTSCSHQSLLGPDVHNPQHTKTHSGTHVRPCIRSSMPANNNNNNVTACPPMVPTSRVVPPVVKTPQKLRVVTRHAV